MDKKQAKVIERMMKKVKMYQGYANYEGKFAYTDTKRVFLCDEILEDYNKEVSINFDNILKYNNQESKMKLDAKEIKEFIKTREIKRTSKKIIPFIYKNEIAFNPFYLLDIIEFCDAKELYYNSEKIAVALFKDKNDVIAGGLMPINFALNKEEKQN